MSAANKSIAEKTVCAVCSKSAAKGPAHVFIRPPSGKVICEECVLYCLSAAFDTLRLNRIELDELHQSAAKGADL